MFRLLLFFVCKGNKFFPYLQKRFDINVICNVVILHNSHTILPSVINNIIIYIYIIILNDNGIRGSLKNVILQHYILP